MSKVPKQVAEFLSKKRIAVVGVSRNFQQPANAIYRKLKGAGYQVYAINPNATQVEGNPCYPDLHSVPEPVEAVMIVTHPDMAAKIARECADLGIRHVWLHRSFGQGSVSKEAVAECKVSFRQQCMIVPENHALLPKAYFESNGPSVCWNHRRLDKWRIWTRIVAIPEILPIGVLHFPGTGIQDNLADKAKKLGIPVWKFGAG
jgi:predicted CoA-binding protein